MKKYFVFVFAGLLLSTASFAQDATSEEAPAEKQSSSSSSDGEFVSKNGHQVLPKSGDIALGIGAGQLLGYAGNMLSGANNGNTAVMQFSNNGVAAGFFRGGRREFNGLCDQSEYQFVFFT